MKKSVVLGVINSTIEEVEKEKDANKLELAKAIKGYTNYDLLFEIAYQLHTKEQILIALYELLEKFETMEEK